MEDHEGRTPYTPQGDRTEQERAYLKLYVSSATEVDRAMRVSEESD